MIDINGSRRQEARVHVDEREPVCGGGFQRDGGDFHAQLGDQRSAGTGTTITRRRHLNNLAVSRVAINNYLSLGASLTVQGTVSVTNGYLVQDPSYNLTAGAITIEATAF